jgi:hypothetical protein
MYCGRWHIVICLEDVEGYLFSYLAMIIEKFVDECFEFTDGVAQGKLLGTFRVQRCGTPSFHINGRFCYEFN